MNLRYLLPCECGQSVPVELRQAGQAVACTCGRTLTVPTMRGIRQLPLAPDDSTPKRASAAWNPTKGAMFAGGMAAVLCGVLLTIYTYRPYMALSRIGFHAPTNDLIQNDLDHIERASPEEVWNVWNHFVTVGLGDRDLSPFLRARAESQRLRLRLIIAATFVAVGIGLSLASVLPTRPRVVPSH